jgi:tRNA modification GTPase
VEKRVQNIYEQLRRVMSGVLVCIDFPEEDLADMSREQMSESIRTCIGDAEQLAATYRTGRAVAEGIPTVICGQTNVGKSSLYNRLVGREAAIVTDIEGTTRDVLRESVTVGGMVTLRLCDTAGLRETGDAVERIGIDRAKQAMDEAELILAVFDAGRALSAEELVLIDQLQKRGRAGQVILPILNKSDLVTSAEAAEIGTHFGEVIRLSAATGHGMDALVARICSLFVDGQLDLRQDAVIATARQQASLLSALQSLRSAADALDAGVALDLCCVDVEAAMSALSSLDGRAVDEDIVNEIFAHFCVGK